nr:unnamed protein product [Callosobruchus analis]
MEELQEAHKQLLCKIAEHEGFQEYNIELQDTEKEVFRKFNDFIRKSGSDLSIGVPTYYGSWEHSCIVLENLKAKGYRLWNKQVPMDCNHLVQGVKEYARFHSVSLAMRLTQPEEFQSLTEGFKPFKTSQNDLRQFLKACIKAGSDLVGDDKESREVLEKLQTTGEEFMLITMADERYHLVVTHGDCWCNNILYKYKENTTIPTDAMLVDFQIAKPGSPVRDVAYFLFFNSSKEDLQKYREYLDIYYKELSDCLRKLSCDIKECFPEDMFEDHWKTIAKYGVYVSMFVLKVSAIEKENAVSKDFYEQFQMTSDSSQFGAVRERIKNLLEFVKQECIV